MIVVKGLKKQLRPIKLLLALAMVVCFPPKFHDNNIYFGSLFHSQKYFFIFVESNQDNIYHKLNTRRLNLIHKLVMTNTFYFPYGDPRMLRLVIII